MTMMNQRPTKRHVGCHSSDRRDRSGMDLDPFDHSLFVKEMGTASRFPTGAKATPYGNGLSFQEFRLTDVEESALNKKINK